MIGFFRRIRKKLADDNQFLKYSRYAIGEIVLVVIGILIALNINNWNSKRIQNQKEEILLTALNKEFKANKKQLDSILYKHVSAMKSNTNLISRLPIEDVQKENLDSLTYHLWNHTTTYTFNPSSGVTNSIMNSSSIDIISNKELRQLLVGWNDLLFDYQEEEVGGRENYQRHLKQYEIKHFRFNQDDMLTDARVDLNFLTSLEFDNYVLSRKNDIEEILENGAKELDAVINAIDRIIELSEPTN